MTPVETALFDDPTQAGIDLAWQANNAFDERSSLQDQFQRWKHLHNEGLIELTAGGQKRVEAEIDTATAVFDELMYRAGVLMGPGTSGGALMETRV